MKKANKILIWLTVVFSSLTLVFLTLFLFYLASYNNYRTQLENSYNKSFYEMVSQINDLEVDLSKIVATTSLSTQRELLSGIYETSMLGVNNINSLPLNYNKLSEVNKLLNTMGGFAQSLLLANYEGRAISSEDYNQINELHTKVQQMQYDLNQYVSKLRYDYSILDDVDFGSVDNSEFSAGILNNESSSSKVPSLIYDGPFSDSVLNKEIKGLEDKYYTLEDVETMLHEVFTGFSIYYTGETSGKFETYNFEVKGDIDLYVSVTKKGGLVLTITGYGSGSNAKLTVEEGVDLAESFASDIGINNMYMVWSQVSGNVLYVNLAPIVDHVIYYSDLIKVKVDLSLGLVVGWEATSYATNHIDRDFTSSVGILDGERDINSQMTIIERNLCIIPDKYVGEISAYEYICTWKDYVYYIYIDANTGDEVNILRVIKTSNGDLLI